MVVVAPNAFAVFAPYLKKKKRSPRQQEFQRNLDALIRQGIIKKIVNSKGKISLELTKRGKWEFFLRHHSLEKNEGKKWDGKWRVVIFDVPNDKTAIRDEMRRAMKLFGFVMIQKSVWAYPYSCDSFVVLLRKYLGIRDDVVYMIVETIENDLELKRKFKL